MNYKALGEKIRKERIRLSLTQEKLAEKVDISESFMGHIERGSRKLSVDTLVKIANELDVSIDYLLLDSTNPKSDIVIDGIISKIKDKNPQQLKVFLNIVKTLANNIDDWS